jgi:hypothetical protein
MFGQVVGVHIANQMATEEHRLIVNEYGRGTLMHPELGFHSRIFWRKSRIAKIGAKHCGGVIQGRR